MTTIERESFRRVDLITVKGRIDASTVSQLEAALEGALNDGRYRLVVNMAGIDFINSGGIRALIAARKESMQHGGAVRIAEPTERIKGVLEIAGITPLFEIYDDETAAVGSF